MVLVAYTNHTSTHGQIFLTCLLEMGLYDSPEVKINLIPWTTVLDEKHRENHPFKQIPWFEIPELDLKFTEVRVALKYLAQKTGSSLVPPASDIKASIKFEAACSYELNNFVFEAQTIGVEKFIKPTFYSGYNETYVKALEANLGLALKGYEYILSKQTFLAGDKLTLVDLFHISHGSLCLAAGGAPALVDGTLPNVKRWWETLMALDSTKKTTEIVQQQMQEQMQAGTMLKTPSGKWDLVKP